MAGMEQFLTKKVGPAPVWVYAAGGGLLASVLFLRKKGAAAAPASPADQQAQQGLYSPSPIVITTPGSMPGGTSSINAPPQSPSAAPPPTPLWQFGFGMPSSTKQWVWHFTGSAAPQGVPTRGVFPASTSNPRDNPDAYPGFGAYSWQWAPVPSESDASGKPWTDTSYAAALNGAGMGGGSVMKFAPNTGGGKVGRFSGKHAHSQFVNVGMGGGGQAGHAPLGRGYGHPQHLDAISKKTGVPMARLMALNPHMWRPGTAGNRGIVHIG